MASGFFYNIYKYINLCNQILKYIAGFFLTLAQVSRVILQKIFWVLRVKGQVIILDGNQKNFRQTEWLTEIFKKPYIKSYTRGTIEA